MITKKENYPKNNKFNELIESLDLENIDENELRTIIKNHFPDSQTVSYDEKEILIVNN